MRGHVLGMWRCWGTDPIASQPAHPVLLMGKVLPCAAGGHWLNIESRAGSVLTRLSEALPGAQ